MMFDSLKNRCEKGPKKTFMKYGKYTAVIKALGFLWLTLFSTGGPALALDTAALPTGGTVTSGSGSITFSGNNMTINQASPKMAANWASFNIGANASVTFNQPDASSVALNRIYSQNPTQIMGSLNANGQIFLINPAGIIFGASATVNVGGIVASTLDITDDNFLSSNYTFTASSHAGSISNAGTVNANGGYVAFLGPVIENTGSVTADCGTVAMAAGNKVSLDFMGDGLITYSIDKGAVEAQVTNQGLIRADGGRVYLSSEAANALTSAVVNNQGVIQAQTLQKVDGQILLMADMETGEIQIRGTLDASAPDGGDGGFIETSAAKVNIGNDAKVDTAAADGETGTWLIDPTDFTIAASGGDITGATLTANLAGTDIVIETADTGAEDGNIYVNDTISWNSNTLTLDADNNIEINSALTATGSARLNLVYTGEYIINAPVSLASSGHFTTNGTVYKIITSLTDLQAVGTDASTLSDNYVLGSNLDGGAGFNPIGDNSDGTGNTRFTGIFDGLGHTVSNLTINSTSNYTGLFGFTHTATIRNIGIAGGSIQGTASHTGGLVGFLSYSTLSNSYVTASVSGAHGTGGLVGRSDGSTITGCYATGNVTGANSTGGLIGIANPSTTITQSYASGVIQGTANVGGLAGIASDTDISDAYFTADAGGSVTGTGSYTGGLVGYLLNDTTITNSYVTADVTGKYCTGGLAGYSSGSTISQSYATGDVNGTGTVGGFAGIIEDSTAAESYATGNVTGNSTVVGGFAGYLTASSGHTSAITNSYATGNVDGLRSVGGLVGLMGSRINKSDLLPDTILDGGNCTITNSYAAGNVTGTTGNGYFVGGLVGYSGALILDNSDSNFEIRNTSSTITSSYASGDVTGVDYVGGLVGYSGAYIGTYSDDATITGTSSTIKNSYAGGTVTGTGSNSGDFLGYSGQAHDGTCNNYTLPAGSSEVQDKNGNTVIDFTPFVLSAEQKNLNFYQTTLNWGANIDANGGTGTIWRIYEDATYPLLRCFLTQTAATAAKVYNGTTNLDTALISWSPGTDETLIYGTASFSGSQINAGSYNLTLSDLYSSQQGYDILANGTLVITPAPLTITADNDSKIYDGTAYSNGNGVTCSGFVNAEGINVLSGTLGYGGTSQGAVDAGTYAIRPSGLTSTNYTITFVSGRLTIIDSNLSNGTGQPNLPTDPGQEVSKKTNNRPGIPAQLAAAIEEGSESLVEFSSLTSENDNAITLVSNSSVATVSFRGDADTLILSRGAGGDTKETATSWSVTVFILEENSSLISQGAVGVTENAGAMSLTKTGSEMDTRLEISTLTNDRSNAQRVPFSLCTSDGATLDMTATLTESGVMIIGGTNGISALNRNQIILLGLQTLRQETDMNLKRIKSVVIDLAQIKQAPGI